MDTQTTPQAVTLADLKPGDEVALRTNSGTRWVEYTRRRVMKVTPKRIDIGGLSNYNRETGALIGQGNFSPTLVPITPEIRQIWADKEREKSRREAARQAEEEARQLAREEAVRAALVRHYIADGCDEIDADFTARQFMETAAQAGIELTARPTA